MGSVLLKKLLKVKKKLLVIDYDPEVIKDLINNKISCIYGDIVSPEVLVSVNSKKLKKVISTVPTYDDNLHLLKTIKEINPDVTVIGEDSNFFTVEKMRLY